MIQMKMTREPGYCKISVAVQQPNKLLIPRPTHLNLSLEVCPVESIYKLFEIAES
jgi:hypothetical protein